MKKFYLIFLLLGACYMPQSKHEVRLSIKHEKTKEVIIYPELEPMLIKIPEAEKTEFLETLIEFGNKRSFDWKLVVLLLYQESGIDKNKVAGQYVGIAMFGNIAQKVLGVTASEILKMSHVEQLRLAIKMWEISEKKKNAYICEFIDLQIANFAPAWFKHPGLPYPANEDIKKANPKVVDEDGNVTKNSILAFYRNKIAKDASLKYFINKI